MVFKIPHATSRVTVAMQSTQADSADLNSQQSNRVLARQSCNFSSSPFDTPLRLDEVPEEMLVEQQHQEAGLASKDTSRVLSDGSPLEPLSTDGEKRAEVSSERTIEAADLKKHTDDQHPKTILEWLLSRTSLCKHKHSCLENTATGALRTFINMYGIKLVINNIFLIANPKKLLLNLMSLKSQKDNVRFALFMALMNGVYKMVLCIMRRVFKKDEIASPIAGFLAGLCCCLDAKNRRKFLMIMLLARVCDTAWSMGESRGLYMSYKYGALLVWMLACVT